MYPTLLELGSLKFHAYPTMLAVAFLVCTLLAARDANMANPPILGDPRGGLWVFFPALIGAKVFWILQFSGTQYLYHAFFLWEGGLVFYGGLIGGVLGGLAYFLYLRLPPLRTGDVIIPYLALGEAIVRIGCFLNGCCWGRPTSMPWGVYFPKGSHPYSHEVSLHLIDKSAAHSLPVHPTQLYMMAGLIGVTLLLREYHKRRHFNGSVLLMYCILYGAVRFTVEIFRNAEGGGDSARSIAGMTVSQTISLFMIVFGAAVFALAEAGMFGRLAPVDTSDEDEEEDEGEEEDDAPANADVSVQDNGAELSRKETDTASHVAE